MRIMSSQWFAGLVNVNTDRVMAAIDIPHEGILNGFGGEVSITAGAIGTKLAIAYDLAGFIAPSPDPEAATTYEILWDTAVEKADDAGSAVIRLEEGSNSTTPVWEPGEVRWGDLANIAILEDDMMFYKRRQLMTFPKRPVGWVDGSPDLYIPTDFVDIRSFAGRRRVHQPSHAMLGISEPVMDDTGTNLVIPAENTREWIWLRNAQQMLEFAFTFMMTTTEAGAEDPWELATLYLEELIAPPILQPTGAGTIFENAATIDWVGKGTFDISVPGFERITSISGGA